jgi:hypothetical protein
MKDGPIVALIISQTFTLVGALLKFWLDKRANNKKQLNRDLALRKTIIGLETTVTTLTQNYDRHNQNEVFQIELINSIQKRMLAKYNLFDTSYPEFTFILTYWSTFIQSFAKLYWYSEYRKDATPPENTDETVESLHMKNKKEELKNYLKTLFLSQENDLIKRMDREISYFLDYAGKKIQFSDLFKDKMLRTLGELTPKNEIFVGALVKNGFQPVSFINEIEQHLTDFYNYVEKHIKTWLLIQITNEEKLKALINK